MKYFLICMIFVSAINANGYYSLQLGSVEEFLKENVTDQEKIIYGLLIGSTTVKINRHNKEYIKRVKKCIDGMTIDEINTTFVHKLNGSSNGWLIGLGYNFKVFLEEMCKSESI